MFNADRHIPDLTGRVVLVTGGNAGLGLEMVQQLAKHGPKRIYLAARSQAKYDVALTEIGRQWSRMKTHPVDTGMIVFLELDLASLASVRRAARQVLAQSDRLDLLINNAGIMAMPPARTVDGYEVQFGTNHMGHAYLTKLLMPLLERAVDQSKPGDVRIVNLTSKGEMGASAVGGFDASLAVTDMASKNTFVRYGQSKVANIYFTRSLAQRFPRITAVAVHPGRVATGIADAAYTSSKLSLTYWIIKVSDMTINTTVDVATGALGPLYAAFSQAVCSGTYYEPIGETGKESKLSKDVGIAETLWDWQEEEFSKFEKANPIA